MNQGIYSFKIFHYYGSLVDNSVSHIMIIQWDDERVSFEWVRGTEEIKLLCPKDPFNEWNMYFGGSDQAHILGIYGDIQQFIVTYKRYIWSLKR